jgi:hypothetical protein
MDRRLRNHSKRVKSMRKPQNMYTLRCANNCHPSFRILIRHLAKLARRIGATLPTTLPIVRFIECQYYKMRRDSRYASRTPCPSSSKMTWAGLLYEVPVRGCWLCYNDCQMTSIRFLECQVALSGCIGLTEFEALQFEALQFEFELLNLF